jgi:hypothetical protein
MTHAAGFRDPYETFRPLSLQASRARLGKGLNATVYRVANSAGVHPSCHARFGLLLTKLA